MVTKASESLGIFAPNIEASEAAGAGCPSCVGTPTAQAQGLKSRDSPDRRAMFLASEPRVRYSNICVYAEK